MKKPCIHCQREIAPEMESPERDLCGECLIYLEDIRQQQDTSDERQIITREMAMDAGMPEMEGHEW